MKNIIENLLLIIVIFVGLGVYTNMVLTPVLTEAIQQETHKVENNIKNDIDNKFKNIEELNSKIPLYNELKSTSKRTYNNSKCGKDSVCIAKKHLTRRQRRRLKE